MYRRSQLEILPNFLLAEEADEIRLDVSSELSLDLATKSTFTPLDITAPIANETVDDFAGDVTTTGTLVIDGTAMGRIDFRNDQDWFAIDLSAGDIVRIAAAGTDVDLRLRDSNGNSVAFDFRDFSANEVIIETVISDAGTYYVSVSDSTSCTDYALSASLIEDDFAGDVTTTGTLAIDGTATGRIDFRDDQDWFAIELDAGDVLQIAAAGLDVNLTLFDSSGQSIASDFRDFSANETLIENAIRDAGVYFVSVAGSFLPNIDYTLSAGLIDGLASLKWRVFPVN